MNPTRDRIWTALEQTLVRQWIVQEGYTVARVVERLQTETGTTYKRSIHSVHCWLSRNDIQLQPFQIPVRGRWRKRELLHILAFHERNECCVQVTLVEVNRTYGKKYTRANIRKLLWMARRLRT